MDKLALERQSLKRLEKALGIYEVASMLYNVDHKACPRSRGIEQKQDENPTIAWAMNNPQAYQEEETDDMDNDTLLDALEEALDNGDDATLEDLLEKLKTRRKLRLGVNRSKISDDRLNLNKHVRSFNSVVNAPQNAFNRLAQLRHEGVDDQEFVALCEDVMNEDDSDNIVSEETSFRIRQIMVAKAGREAQQTERLRRRERSSFESELRMRR